jgi:hypothetical protein
MYLSYWIAPCRHHVQANVVAVVDHDAVGPDVNPIAVEIPGHDAAPGTDIAPAILLVPERRRKGEKIHFAVFLDVLENRSGLGDDRIIADGLRLPRFRFAAELLHQRVMRAFHAEAQNRGEPRRAAGAAREHAESLRIAGDFVKEQGRRQIFPHVDFADCAQFEIPVRALHVFHFAKIADRAQPVAQVEGISSRHTSSAEQQSFEA